MSENIQWMQRALQLARLGAGAVAPNPLVGAVLVRREAILAEGWHAQFGGAHAEVECLRAFGDGPVPDDAVLHVTLEPCSHHGKTPPCTDLLIARGVKKVMVAHVDPFPEVSGAGIERMKAAGIDVHVGIAEAEARWTNRYYLTSVQKGRPYVILKWASSSDGFLDRHPRKERGVQRITTERTNTLVHQWRSEVQAILVGSRTVINDDPSLTVRHVKGRSPLRVVIDRQGITSEASKVYDGGSFSLLFTGTPRPEISAQQFILTREDEPIPVILGRLHQLGVRSVLVEGGGMLLEQFLQIGSWDEARVIHGVPVFEQGTAAPTVHHAPVRSIISDGDRIDLHINPNSPAHGDGTPAPTWPW